MSKLSTKERLVLLALQAHAPGLNEHQLEMITHLPTETLQDCLSKLEALGRTHSVAGRLETCYVASPLSEVPLFPNWERWLALFCEAQPQYAEGDTLATMYCQCGVVLLTAIVAGTRDIDLISEVTTLPPAFVMLVLDMADTWNIWDLDSIFHLQERLSSGDVKLDQIESTLHWVKEDLWEYAWTPAIEATLHQYRAGHQIGGKVDWWIDSEVAALFGASTAR